MARRANDLLRVRGDVAMRPPKERGWYFTKGFSGLYDDPLYFDGYRWLSPYFGRSDLLKPVTMNGSWRKKKQVAAELDADKAVSQ